MNDNDRALKASHILATSIASTAKGQRQIDEMRLFVRGFAEPGFGGNLLAVWGDFQPVCRFDSELRSRVVIDSTPELIRKQLNDIGIDTLNPGEWKSCTHCQRLCLADNSAYNWHPSFVTNKDSEIICVKCLELEPEKYFDYEEPKLMAMRILPKSIGFHKICKLTKDKKEIDEVVKCLKIMEVFNYVFNVDHNYTCDLWVKISDFKGRLFRGYELPYGFAFLPEAFNRESGALEKECHANLRK